VQPSLTDAQVLALAEHGHAHRNAYYGAPQDIEWAIDAAGAESCCCSAGRCIQRIRNLDRRL
jgi:phosphoenolpyruvate synthase/pyruvate phosphate dikinase